MAIQQVIAKQPDHIKKKGSGIQTDRQADKGEDIFSILLSLSMNVANQGVKDSGLAENKIEVASVAKAGDKKEGSDDKNDPTLLKWDRKDVVSDGLLMRLGLTKGDENGSILRHASPEQSQSSQDDNHGVVKTSRSELVELLSKHDRPLGVPSGESPMSRGFTKGDENPDRALAPSIDGQRTNTAEHIFSDKVQSMMETDFKLPVDTIPDSIVNPQIENLDNNKLLNENGLLVTAVKGTPVNTDSNNISTQPVYRYADQGNLIQYMSQQIIHASNVGTHTAKIRLRPAELGDLRLDISVADKNVKALIVVENEEIKKMVESSFNSLRDELKNQGLNVEQFSVEIQKDDFMDNFKSMYERQEKGSKKWGNIVPDINPGSTEHPLMMPLSLIKGGLSLFA